MFLRPLSDLHIEFNDYRWRLPPLNHTVSEKETVVILAGDIGCGSRHKEFVHDVAARHRAVVYVPGNHEYYSRDCVQKVDQFWKDEAENVVPNLFYLNPGAVEIDGVQFVGATMWTSFNNGSPIIMHSASAYMNDYREIKWRDSQNNYRKLRPVDVLGIHAQHRRFMQESVAARDTSKKLVVVSHHVPTFAVQPPCDRVHDTDFCYYDVGMNDMFFEETAPDAWVFGHTHDRTDQMFGRTHFYSNPRGYDCSGGRVNEFDPHFVFEV